MRSSSSSRGHASSAAARRARRRAGTTPAGTWRRTPRRRAPGAARRTPRTRRCAPSTPKRDDHRDEIAHRHVGQARLHQPVRVAGDVDRRRVVAAAMSRMPEDERGVQRGTRRRRPAARGAAPSATTLHEGRLGGVRTEQLGGSTGRARGARGRAARARCPSRRAARRPGVRTAGVTVNCAASAPAARSSTATISVTRGPSGPRAQWTTTSMLSLTSVLSAVSGSSLAESDSWQMKRSRVSAWRAEPAWIVVKPFTPDDSVSSSGSASRSRTSPTIATSGAMRRKPATSWRRSTAGRSGRAGRVCMLATFGSGTSASNTSSATTTRRAGSSSAAQHESSVVLPDPGAPATTIVCRARTHAARKRRGRGGQHVPLDELVEVAERDAGELADVDHHVTAAADVAVHDVQPGAVVELRVLQALGRVELAVRARRVVEDLGEGADDVLVVVEDLVVVAGPPAVALHEDRRPAR